MLELCRMPELHSIRREEIAQNMGQVGACTSLPVYGPHHQDYAGRFHAMTRIPRHLGECHVFSVNSMSFRDFHAAGEFPKFSVNSSFFWGGVPQILCEFHVGNGVKKIDFVRVCHFTPHLASASDATLLSFLPSLCSSIYRVYRCPPGSLSGTIVNLVSAARCSPQTSLESTRSVSRTRDLLD